MKPTSCVLETGPKSTSLFTKKSISVTHYATILQKVITLHNLCNAVFGRTLQNVGPLMALCSYGHVILVAPTPADIEPVKTKATHNQFLYNFISRYHNHIT